MFLKIKNSTNALLAADGEDVARERISDVLLRRTERRSCFIRSSGADVMRGADWSWEACLTWSGLKNVPLPKCEAHSSEETCSKRRVCVSLVITPPTSKITTAFPSTPPHILLHFSNMTLIFYPEWGLKRSSTYLAAGWVYVCVNVTIRQGNYHQPAAKTLVQFHLWRFVSSWAPFGSLTLSGGCFVALKKMFFSGGIVKTAGGLWNRGVSCAGGGDWRSRDLGSVCVEGGQISGTSNSRAASARKNLSFNQTTEWEILLNACQNRDVYTAVGSYRNKLWWWFFSFFFCYLQHTVRS